MNLKKYNKNVESAIRHFWDTRNKQKNEQEDREVKDKGNRSSVTGGKQLDGFISLLHKVAVDVGIPGKYIYTNTSVLKTEKQTFGTSF